MSAQLKKALDFAKEESVDVQSLSTSENPAASVSSVATAANTSAAAASKPIREKTERERKMAHINSDHYPYDSPEVVPSHHKIINSNEQYGSLTLHGPSSIKLYLLGKTHILFIEDIHIKPRKECEVIDGKEVIWVDEFIQTILDNSGPTMFFFEHGEFYKNFEEAKQKKQRTEFLFDTTRGFPRTSKLFDKCLIYEKYDCKYITHSINNMEFRRFTTRMFNLSISDYLLNIPLGTYEENLGDISEYDVRIDNSVFDTVYIYVYRMLQSVQRNQPLMILEKESIIEILRTLKENFSNLIDALFAKDVDIFINCLLSFVQKIVPDIFTRKFHTLEAREIYKKILKQLSSGSKDDNISNSELLKYFKSNIVHIINNKKLDELILNKDKINLDPMSQYIYIKEILIYLSKVYLMIGTTIFDIYNLKRYLRQMPLDESEFKLVIIYAGRGHTIRYIDFFFNTKQTHLHQIFETNITSDGCTTFSKIQLDKLNRILGYINNQYKADEEKLNTFIKIDDKIYDISSIKKVITDLKKYITDLKDEIYKIQQKPQYDKSEYKLKTDHLENLILHKKYLSLKYVKTRNILKNSKKKILQMPQETKESDTRPTTVSVAAITPDKFAVDDADTLATAPSSEFTFAAAAATSNPGGYYPIYFHHCY